jgi:hypothetical protein
MANIMVVTEAGSWNAPKDVYRAAFVGTRPRDDNGTPTIGRNGQPMEPGIVWEFRITEGPFTGRILSRITGTSPTTGNICGKLLAGLIGRTFTVGEKIDIDAFVNKEYRAVVGQHSTDPERTQLVQIMPLAAGTSATPSPLPSTPAPASASPPTSAPPPRTDLAEYWVVQIEGQDGVRMTAAALQEWIGREKRKPDTVPVCRTDSTTWRTAADFGFTEKVPY